jgi:hypothetical protein
MKILSLMILTLSLSNLALAEIDKTGEGDVLLSVSQKLTQINSRLKDQRVFLSPAVVNWAQMDTFKSQIIFTVAHDPHGSGSDTPAELSPGVLTLDLKKDWNALEESVLSIGDVQKNPEWLTLKTEMTQFFKYRDEFMYQPARAMIKSGTLMSRLTKVKESAMPFLSDSTNLKNVSVRVIDPVIEKMTAELNVLNASVNRLKELRTPPPVEKPTIFQARFTKELYFFGCASFLSGLFLTMVFYWLKKKMVKEPVEVKPAAVVDAFNYHEWLKVFEKNLQALKNNEENTNEENIHLKGYASTLSEGRKFLNSADNQQDYYIGLEQVNSSAVKIEEHFEKINFKKSGEPFRRLISQIIQLCEVVENKKEISFDDPKPKLRAFKQEQVLLKTAS